MNPERGDTSPREYHHRSKHQFGRFARSLGYLDWATQPSPFRRFDGAPLISLPREPLHQDVPWGALFTGGRRPSPLTDVSVGEFLRCSLGLSAWKSYGQQRWALRVNPSSGNLHPTEGYVVWHRRVLHYAPDVHAVEERGLLPIDLQACLTTASGDAVSGVLVALTSIHWREAWKYGERAFRYCQHDIGHALGALRLSAALQGWTLTVLSDWSDANVATVLGLDRDQDFQGAEREVPALIACVTAEPQLVAVRCDSDALVESARHATWAGRANTLSPTHVDWPVIDAVSARATYPGLSQSVVEVPPAAAVEPEPGPPARHVLLTRRSATAFDEKSVLSGARFRQLLTRLRPQGVPWDSLPWAPQVHLVMFVHRVEGLVPGLYAFLRCADGARAEWQALMRDVFLWEAVPGTGQTDADGLFLLAPFDLRQQARQLSCQQDIAADGYLSLAMVGRMASVTEGQPWAYRHLFWECGLIGQMLYLEAEVSGGRGTGIGCFFDDPVHELLGLGDDTWQSFYHFAMGTPLDDRRLTTEPGYPWELTTSASGAGPSQTR